MNDINVVEASPVLDKISNGEYPPPCKHRNNSKRSSKPCLLLGLVYPHQPAFIYMTMEPSTKNHKLIASMKESARRDTERAIGVLKYMRCIIIIPSRFESITSMQKVMTCMVILHNMVVEEREFNAPMERNMVAENTIVRSGILKIWE